MARRVRQTVDNVDYSLTHSLAHTHTHTHTHTYIHTYIHTCTHIHTPRKSEGGRKSSVFISRPVGYRKKVGIS